MGVGGVIRRLQILGTLRDLRHQFNGKPLQAARTNPERTGGATNEPTPR